MVDGIFDLVTAILVLGIVIAIALGFILPLTGDEVMQYSTAKEDKAMVNYAIDYSNSEILDSITRRYYTYPELVLLMTVQDSRMESPKGINLRDLSELENLYLLNTPTLRNRNINDYRNNAKVQNIDWGSKYPVSYALYIYGENGRGTDPMGGIDNSKINLGTIKFTETYPLDVDGLCKLLSARVEVPNEKFYISYHYSTKGKIGNFDSEPLYMVHKYTSSLDTGNYYKNYISNNLR